MFKVITICGEDYKLEYTFEAALFSEGVEKVFELMYDVDGAADPRDALMGSAKIPDIAFTLFYAGLLEHHGPEGDGSVRSKRDAKILAKQYMNDDKLDFAQLLKICVDQIGEDGFFERIGLATMMQSEEPKTTRQPKTPQDHKKKTVKVSEEQ